MHSIPFLVLGTNFHFDENTGQVVRPLFHSSFYTEFNFDDEDPDRSKKLLEFYAEQCCFYDHTVVVDMSSGHICAYKKLREDDRFYYRNGVGNDIACEYFYSMFFEPSGFTDKTPIREE